ncbi:MAG: transglycosylase domain-containing protein [Eubacterium sp.]|nr:transglycosylase domain-containing protein [Eubacterium sp.]
MASKNYDDLLESFMNNSQQVYNEDKDKQRKGNLPSSYNVRNSEKHSEQAKRNRKPATQNNQQTKKQPKKSPRKQRGAAATFFGNLGKTLLALIMVAGVVTVVCSSVIVIYGLSVINGDAVFDLDKEKYSQNQTSFIYGYENNNKKKPVEITRLHGEENRIWLSKKEMPKYLPLAFIACEDERFQTHHGVDWKRVGGVILVSGNQGQGGSTITQQLIKNLTDQNDVTFVRKFNEILSALNLEKHYSKDEIIEAYLNTIYLSNGCYGVRTAAETYFGKDVENLNIAECACLASITQYPSRYDPLTNPEQLNPENNVSRRRWILGKMKEKGFITEAQYNEAINYKMVYTNSKNYKGSTVKNKNKKKGKQSINSYYTDYVIEEVIEDLQKMGYSAKKSRDMIYGGGLKIYSAIDFDVQDAIEDVYVKYRRMPDESVQGACVVMDYKGRILGIVGGCGKKKANRTLNRASQSTRQPGSTIKPLSVYGPALEKSLQDKDTKIYWSTPVKDAPLMTLPNGEQWPTNEGGGYSGGSVSIQKGLANSMNTISARTLDMIGPSYSYDYITSRFHISTLEVQDENYAPMATGALTNGVTTLEMTSAYQAFGNGGYYYEGYAYYKIEDSQGNVIIEKKPDETKEAALSEDTAGIMNKLLQTVMTEGTGTTYKLSGIECFGKTGTTTDDKDRWFMGGTPEYIAGVWYGYDTPKEVVYYLSPNPSGTIWNLVMQNIYEKKGIKKTEFKQPDGIVQLQYSPENGKICTGSGMYGWYDKDNLPGTTTYVPTTTTEKSTEKESTQATTSSNNNANYNNGNAYDTTAATQAQTTAAPAPTQPATAAPQNSGGKNQGE